MVFFILILVHSFSWSEEVSESELLYQYETLQPFHENMAIIMPEKKCQNADKNSKIAEHCWIDIQWEDNSEPFEELLQKTEKFAQQTDFIHTPLGQKYQQVKNLMNIHKKLKSCSTDNSVVNDDILYRTQSNISQALENPDQCNVSNSKDSIALFGNHLQQVTQGKIPTESSFEDDLFSQALKTSIQTRIHFTKQIGNDNINTENFKQKLLDKFCVGNIPVSTSRGTRNKKDYNCNNKDEEIINRLIEEAVNSANNKELIQHPTKFSHQEEDCFTIQRKHKCVQTNIYEFNSYPPPFFSEIAEDSQMDSLNTPTIVADINYRIANLNSILEDYNDQKKELEEKWTLENKRLNQELNLPEKRKADHEHSLKRKKFDGELKRLKKTAFLEYKQELALLHTSGAGALLQTNAIRNNSTFKELEKITAKGLGVLGFEETELTHKENFPLLKPINDRTAQLAVKERLQRMDQHIESLLTEQRNKHKTDQEYLDRLQQVSSSEDDEEDLKKWYNDQRFKRLSKLVLSNPQITSHVLMNNPEYSSILCETSNRIEKDEQFKDMLKTGMLIGSAIGSVAVGLLTSGVGAPASMASALSVATGTGLTLADFAFRVSEANRHSRNQEDLLNAYLSQTGDDQSIEDMRIEWKSKVKQQFHAGWALALGTFDIYRINSSIKRGRLAKKNSPLPVLRIQNNQLHRTLTGNNQYLESIQGLLQKYPTRSVQRLLNSVKRLPPDQQRTVLDSFPKIVKHDSFNLTAFSREIKQSATKEDILQILKRWSVCLTCKTKVGTKKTKGTSDKQSTIETSTL